MRAVIVLAAAVASVALGTVARAQDGDGLLRHAEQLQVEGEHEAAVLLLRQAAERDPTPRLWGQMALSELELERYRDAERHLQRALAAEDDEWVADNRSRLAEALARAAARLGTLVIVGGPEGATLHDGDRELGTLPVAPQRLSTGEHDLELRLPGGSVRAHEVTVEPGATTRLRLHPDGTRDREPERTETRSEPEPEYPEPEPEHPEPEPEYPEPEPEDPGAFGDFGEGSDRGASAAAADVAFPSSFRDRFARGSESLPEPRTREPWPSPWHLLLYGGVGWLYHSEDFSVPTDLDGRSGNSVALSGALGARHALGLSTEFQARLELRAYEHSNARSYETLSGDPVFHAVSRQLEGWVLGVVPEVGARFRLATNGATHAYFGLGARLGLAIFMPKRVSQWQRYDGDDIEVRDRGGDVGFAPEGLVEFGVVMGKRQSWDLGLRMTGGLPGFSIQLAVGVPLAGL